MDTKNSSTNRLNAESTCAFVEFTEEKVFLKKWNKTSNLIKWN